MRLAYMFPTSILTRSWKISGWSEPSGVGRRRRVFQAFHLQEDQVCLPQEGRLHIWLFLRVLHYFSWHVRLPFSNFNISVLWELNVVPTQLHPNGWTFMQTFFRRMQGLGFDSDACIVFVLFPHHHILTSLQYLLFQRRTKRYLPISILRIRCLRKTLLKLQ